MGLCSFEFYLCAMRSIHSKEYKIFLRRLTQAREDAGLTQADVASKFGKPQSFVSKCEQGERTVDAIDLFRFANIYKISIEQLFEGIDID